MNEPMTPERMVEAQSMVRMLRNFAGNMPYVRYDEAAILLDDALAEVKRLRARPWLNTLAYAATALEASADNGDRYAAQQIRDHLAALASGDECPTCHQLDPCPTHNREQWVAENRRTAALASGGERLSDDDLPGMWSHADFEGGDPDERSYAQREREAAALASGDKADTSRDGTVS